MPLTVLLVEDNDADAAIITRMLGLAKGPGLRVIRCTRWDGALLHLAGGDVDIALLDLCLPDSRRSQTLDHLVGIAPAVPIIVLSASRDERHAVTAVRNGAQDYLAKDQLTPVALSRAIACAIERHLLVTTIREQSLTDDLTGLYNRRGFLSLGEAHLQLAQRSLRRFVLLYADLDGLKQINDGLGHREGDRALARAAEVLRSSFRLTDVIGRLGGDEFAVVAVEAAGDTEITLVRRFRNDLAAFNARSGLPYELCISVGVAGYEPACVLSLEQRLAEADRALYASRLGRRSTARLRAVAY